LNLLWLHPESPPAGEAWPVGTTAAPAWLLLDQACSIF
jgi:hypothetical protein